MAKKKIMWSQCRLQKDNTIMISYIPERGAIIGASVEVLEDDGVTKGFYKVLSAGPLRTTEFIREAEKNVKNHRKVTDI